MESSSNESLEQRVQRLEAHIQALKSDQLKTNARLSLHEFILEFAIAVTFAELPLAFFDEYIRRFSAALDNPVLPKSVSPGIEQDEAALGAMLSGMAKHFLDNVAAREKYLRALNGL